MSKIICEICGTAYPETAKECPICGYPRNPLEVELELDPENEPQQTPQDPAAAAHRVKGGRFSNKNVKQRLIDEQTPQEPGTHVPEMPEQPRRKKSRWLWKLLTVVILLAALAVGVQYAYRYVYGGENPAESGATSAPTEKPVLCTDLKLDRETLVLEQAGSAYLLSVTPTPADTTEKPVFVSGDEAVATVSDKGAITAVGPGSTVISVICGGVTRECVVTCSFELPTEASETVPATMPSIPQESGALVLSHSDVTLRKAGETFRIKATDAGQILSNVQLQWVSSDPEVASVDNGVVTAVRTGEAVITGIYGEYAQECLVRVNIPGVDAKEPTRPEHYADTNWRLTIAGGDVTIKVGETFRLGVVNDAGEAAETLWESSEAGVVTIDGNLIKGAQRGTTEVTATVDGQTFTCIVRVSG